MFDALIDSAAQTWGVPVSWIQAVIQTESSWNPDATGSVGERGLMQISPGTAALYGWDFAQMYDPALNIDSGTHLLHDLRLSYGDDFRRVYAAYNSGNPDSAELQVLANVQRAVDNLAMYESDGASLAGMGGVMLLVLIGWFLFRRHG